MKTKFIHIQINRNFTFVYGFCPGLPDRDVADKLGAYLSGLKAQGLTWPDAPATIFCLAPCEDTMFPISGDDWGEIISLQGVQGMSYMERLPILRDFFLTMTKAKGLIGPTTTVDDLLAQLQGDKNLTIRTYLTFWRFIDKGAIRFFLKELLKDRRADPANHWPEILAGLKTRADALSQELETLYQAELERP